MQKDFLYAGHVNKHFDIKDGYNQYLQLVRIYLGLITPTTGKKM